MLTGLITQPVQNSGGALKKFTMRGEIKDVLENVR